MPKYSWLILPLLLFQTFLASGQPYPIDSIRFFTDEQPIEMTLTTDIKKLQVKNTVEVYQPAEVSLHLNDNTIINEKIRLYARGKFRRENCFLPPIMLDFHNSTSPKLYSLSRLKLVIGCGTGSIDEQLLLKEFLIYKMYNLLDQKSFRARLIKVNYTDSRGKMKPYSQYAFLLEDVDDMAKRNECVAGKKTAFQIEETDRAQMNKVDIFEYMIGNTDWSVPGNHNIKVIFPQDDAAAKGFPVPYDFDNAGLVNAYYATPSEVVGATFVTERVYRGFPRTMDEIQRTLEIFRNKKESIYSLVRNFDLLKSQTRSEIITYLDDFYKLINDRVQVKATFIDNARKQ